MLTEKKKIKKMATIVSKYYCYSFNIHYTVLAFCGTYD